MANIIKLLLLFLWLDIFIYWIFTLNYIFIVIGFVNTIFLLKFLKYNFDFIWDILFYIRNIDISNIKIKKNIDMDFWFKKNLGEFLIILRDINKHYIFIISLLVFIFILFSKLIWFKSIDLNIYVSFIILFISIILWYKDIIIWNIFIWEKKLKFIDYIVFTSIIIFYIFFNINWKLYIYERFFIASLFSLLFFIFTIKFLWIREYKCWKYKISSYFIIIFILSLLYFSYWFFNIKNMYNDFYVWKTKIITEKLWEKVFVTADNKEYRIVRNDEWYILKSFNGEDYLFNTLKEAEDYILWYFRENKFLDDKLTDIKNKVKLTLTWTLTDKELIPYILKNKDYDYLYNVNLVLPNISSDIKYYKYYNIAVWLGMISNNSDLSDSVYCMNYIAMLWIAEKWNIKGYWNINIFKKYYSEWIKRWVVPTQCIKNSSQLFKWEFLE